MKLRWTVVSLAIALMLILAGIGLSQVTTATLYGIVQDQSGSVIAGAQITLTHEATAAVRQTTTDETGEFVLTALPVGAYALKIEKRGFKAYVRTRIELAASQNVRQTHALEVGELTQSVTVESSAPLVNTVSAEQRESLDSHKVGELPLSRRNVTNILRLSSGVDTGLGSVRINGQGKSGAGVTVDGTDANSNPSEGRAMAQYGERNYIDVMSIEAVQEVQLMRGIMAAEYGGVISGQVNLISKSGSNQWHGSLFENYRSHLFNARNPFAVNRRSDGSMSPKNREVFNQFGGSLGGPVLRDRAFFFFTYEGYRESAFQRVTGTVPTAKLRSDILRALPFQESNILLDTLPLPTLPIIRAGGVPDADLGTFEGAGQRASTENHIVIRGDLLVTKSSNLTVTYTRNTPYGLDPQYNLNGANDRVYDYYQPRLTSQYVFSRGPWVAETRFGYNHQDMLRLDKFFTFKDPKTPEKIEWQRRVARLSIQGLNTWGAAEVWDMEGTTYSVDQKLSRHLGRHLFKFGGRYVRSVGSRTNPENPLYTFNNLADLEANIPGTVNITFGSHGPHSSRMFEFGFFGQDDFRVNSRLVLNLGLRYDFYSNNVVKPTGDVPVGIVNLSPATDLRRFNFGPPRPLDNPVEHDGWANLGPRLGFAYDFDGKGKTVVRGGFGVLFAGQVPALYRQSVAHPVVPFRIIYSRAEAQRLGIRYPFYAEEVLPIAERDVAASGRKLIFSVLDPKLQNPYTMNFQLNVQRSLTADLMLEVGYVGVRGVKFPLHRRFNLPDRVTGERPNPQLIPGGFFVDNSESTVYHSLQTSLRKRFTRGLSFDAHYTYGKALAFSGGDVGVYYGTDVNENVIQDFFNLATDRGPSTGDVTHRFIGDTIYRMPELKDWGFAPLRHALGGWQVSGIFTARSGSPVFITQSCSNSYHCRPDYVGGNTVLKERVETGTCRAGGHCDIQYINTAAFNLVPVNQGMAVRPGTAGKSLVRTPGAWNVELSLAKNFKITEKKTLTFRADMFNALNHVNLGGPNGSINSSQFGRISGAGGMRSMQMGLRFQF
ncbi:MAG TPA: TonB-dependent receptor [Blastocatellia bacterium]|jgi:Outer membrane receptor for ferrienterochelin and colicins